MWNKFCLIEKNMFLSKGEKIEIETPDEVIFKKLQSY